MVLRGYGRRIGAFFGFVFVLFMGMINWRRVDSVNFGGEDEDEDGCEEVLMRCCLIARQNVEIWTAVLAVRGCDWLAVL